MEKKSTKYILFDMDGVIYDSKDAFVGAAQSVLKNHFGKMPPRDSILKYYWANDREAIKLLISEMGKKADDIDGIVREYKDLYENGFLPRCAKMIEGAREIIEAAAQKGYKLGAVTNNSKTTAERALSIFGLGDFFEVVVTVDDVKEGKPSPEPIVKAMDVLGCHDKDVCFYIGDSKSDFLAGKAAGIKVILFSHGGTFPHDTDGAIKVNSLSKIMEIVEKCET